MPPQLLPTRLAIISGRWSVGTLNSNYKKKRQGIVFDYGDESFLAFNFYVGGSTIPHLTAFHHYTNDKEWQIPGFYDAVVSSCCGDEFTVMHSHFSLSHLVPSCSHETHTQNLSGLHRNWNHNLLRFCPVIQSFELSRKEHSGIESSLPPKWLNSHRISECIFYVKIFLIA